MGVSCWLGEKKLRRLRSMTGLPLNGAVRTSPSDCEGRTVDEEAGVCYHWLIDPYTGAYEPVPYPTHWTSCPGNQPEGRAI